MLKAGDAVMAAARRPEQSPGLKKLKALHGDALQLVKLDINDGGLLKVLASCAIVYCRLPKLWLGSVLAEAYAIACEMTALRPVVVRYIRLFCSSRVALKAGIGWDG